MGSWQGLVLTSDFGDFEDQKKVSVGDCIPKIGVMFNWDINPVPLLGSLMDQTGLYFIASQRLESYQR